MTTLLCPTCGQSIVRYELRRYYRERYPIEQLWDGGPLVVLRGELPAMELVANELVLGPCGDTTTWTPDQPAPTFQPAPQPEGT